MGSRSPDSAVPAELKTLGSWIWQALNNDIYALIRRRQAQADRGPPLFIEGIDKDITSDITTRIIFEALADFNAHMIDTYPQFKSGGHRIGTVKCQLGTSLRVTGWTSHSNCP